MLAKGAAGSCIHPEHDKGQPGVLTLHRARLKPAMQLQWLQAQRLYTDDAGVDVASSLSDVKLQSVLHVGVPYHAAKGRSQPGELSTDYSQSAEEQKTLHTMIPCSEEKLVPGSECLTWKCGSGCLAAIAEGHHEELPHGPIKPSSVSSSTSVTFLQTSEQERKRRQQEQSTPVLTYGDVRGPARMGTCPSEPSYWAVRAARTVVDPSLYSTQYVSVRQAESTEMRPSCKKAVHSTGIAENAHSRSFPGELLCEESEARALEGAQKQSPLRRGNGSVPFRQAWGHGA
ncbi:hypothetical protein TREES_T100012872 [Tupaia chinensis]|uniref:Uncharacterized protein n=1 Tax=Tupaia chinensis TaxID=246437 RepID=L9LEG2_TUPCH|nr:hypothetical protein TREES_T100012872 [Tupaia chinensis]